MRLKLHISPCPNDTFMFDALVNGRIDTGSLRFEVEYHDIEELNRGAGLGRADISPAVQVPRLRRRSAFRRVRRSGMPFRRASP